MPKVCRPHEDPEHRMKIRLIPAEIYLYKALKVSMRFSASISNMSTDLRDAKYRNREAKTSYIIEFVENRRPLDPIW